jgi:biopolymer transport protein ExbD
MKAGGKRELFAEINITPLTDIFLVLLIIMMVVAPMLDTKGLKVAVPSVGPSSDTKDEPKIIKLAIDESGAYSIDGKPVGKMTLVAKLHALKADHPDGVVINTNPESSHEALTFAMDAAQQADITKLAVTADNK